MGSGKKSAAKIQGRQDYRSCLSKIPCSIRGGHGLLAHIMLILDDSSKTAIAVDKKIPLNAKKMSNALITSWPRLKNRVIYQEMPVQEIAILPDDIVVSAHACGSLTDLIIDKAFEQHARVAVLPCCHDL